MVVKMQKLTKFISLLFVIFMVGCKVDVGTNESEIYKVMPISGNIRFEDLKSYIMTPNCIRCHSWAGNEAEVQQRIIVGNPMASILYQKIKSGQMPPSGALSTKQLLLVENYIKNTKSAPTIPLNSTYKSIQFHLINKSCIGCHNDKGTEVSFEGYDNLKRRADGIINVLEEGDSADQPMPPYEDDKVNRKAPLPTPAVLAALKAWVSEGMQNN
jgi:mono/diheme cytochrome c family protein